MHRALMNSSNPLSFELRQRIIFNRLPSNEKQFIRLREGINNQEKLKVSINCGIASVVKYHLNQMTISNDNIDAQILSENNVYFYPVILKLLLNASVNSNRLSLEAIRSALPLVTHLYVNLKRTFDASPTQRNRSLVDSLVTSAAILIHHAEGWNIRDAYTNTSGRIIVLHDDAGHENVTLLTNFQLSINQVQYHEIASNIEASSPEVYCSITEDSRKRIQLYDRGQFEEVNIVALVQQTAACLHGFFSPCISSVVDGYRKFMADKSNAEKIGAFDSPDIPEEYLCQITQEIMTNPVYDINHVQYKFERSEILKALLIKKENPYTRTPLHETDLVEDSELKGKISFFINSLSEVIEATNLIESVP
jgi:hypothetical protein